MGRHKLIPEEKKQLVRVFVKKSKVDLIGEQNLKSEIDSFINQLERIALQKCADESLKQ